MNPALRDNIIRWQTEASGVLFDDFFGDVFTQHQHYDLTQANRSPQAHPPRYPRKLPADLVAEEVARLLAAAKHLKIVPPWPLPAPRASGCVILSQCPHRLAAAAAGPG